MTAITPWGRCLVLLVSALATQVASSVSGDTLRVPSEYATINGAMGAASAGDTVLVGPGIYDETETRGGGFIVHTSVAFLRDGVSLISEAGLASTTLRADGVGVGTNAVIDGSELGSLGAVVEGFRITGTMPGLAGLWVELAGVVEVRNCEFVDLDNGRSNGGAIWADLTTLDLRDCTFLRCKAADTGGGILVVDGVLRAESLLFDQCGVEAIRIDNLGGIATEPSWIRDTVVLDTVGPGIVLRGAHGALERLLVVGGSDRGLSVNGIADPVVPTTVEVRHCLVLRNQGGMVWSGAAGLIEMNTFVGNERSFGSAMAMVTEEAVLLRRNIIAGSRGSAALRVALEPPVDSCNLFWNNADGDAEFFELDESTLFSDPEFCSPATDDYSVSLSSPCLPENSGGCGQIGALGQGCGTVPVEAETWSRIKARFREGNER